MGAIGAASTGDTTGTVDTVGAENTGDATGTVDAVGAVSTGDATGTVDAVGAVCGRYRYRGRCRCCKRQWLPCYYFHIKEHLTLSSN